jgi:hypothetical protein
MPPCSGSRYNRGMKRMMQFMVKITIRTGGDFWLSAANKDGFRTIITSRQSADVFQTYEDANIVIRKLPQAFKVIGRTFSVEPAD